VEFIQVFENPIEVLRTASSFLLIDGILYFSIKRLDECLDGARIGKNMGAVVAPAKIPYLTVIAIGDLDVVFIQAGSIESPCLEENQR
jgi:hypothetical protein